MASMLMLWDIASDTGTLSAAGTNPGGWVEGGGLSVQNLRTDDVMAVARYTDIAATTARVKTAMARARPIDIVAVINHNGSEAGTWRPLLSANADLSASIYQPDPMPMWGATYIWGSRPFGDFPFSGIDTGNYPGAPILWHRLTEPVTAQYLGVDFIDPGNAAGYFQAGRLMAGVAWQPPINFSFGSSIGVVDASEKKRTDGGRRLVRRRAKWRTWKIALAYQDRRAAMGVYLDLMWLKGIAGDLFLVWDPAEDAAVMSRQILYGALSATGEVPIERYGRWSVTFEFEELI
ncbi:hypothetical protein [Niveispirillum sp.]|uniref:hypothetical protein n=1 Tax=Niveispirillum sp. TaxID=1917217 RepID=UPI001B433A2D|nr:hypothetical protein [Niveispirillum sp.]MBP7340614.1 hypothetical protein [Niveispirillum sp.]